MSALRRKSLMLTGKKFSLIHLGWVVNVVKSLKLRGARVGGGVKLVNRPIAIVYWCKSYLCKEVVSKVWRK